MTSSITKSIVNISGDGISDLWNKAMVSIVEAIFSTLNSDDISNAVSASNSWINVFFNKKWLKEYELARTSNPIVMKQLYERREEILMKDYREFRQIFEHEEMENLLKRLTMIDYHIFSTPSSAQLFKCDGNFIECKIGLPKLSNFTSGGWNTILITENHVVVVSQSLDTRFELLSTILLYNKRTFILERTVSCRHVCDVRASPDGSYLVFIFDGGKDLGIWDLISFKFARFSVTSKPFANVTFSEIRPGPNYILAFESRVQSTHSLNFFILKLTRKNGSLNLVHNRVETSLLSGDTWNPCSKISIIQLSKESEMRVSIATRYSKRDSCETKIGFLSFTIDSSSDSLPFVDQREHIISAEDGHFFSLLDKTSCNCFCFDDFIIFNNTCSCEIQAWSLVHKKLVHRFRFSLPDAYFIGYSSECIYLQIEKDYLLATERIMGELVVWWNVENDIVENLKHDLKAGIVRCTESSYYYKQTDPIVQTGCLRPSNSHYVCNKTSITRYYVRSVPSSEEYRDYDLYLVGEESLPSLCYEIT